MGDLTPISLSNGIDLLVWQKGPTEAPALLFLHGFPESHRSWRHQIAHLAPHYRCIAPDLRGYGASSRPEGAEAYATPALVGDVVALADALGLERFTVLGHDWGGVLAWAVAATDTARAQGRVERLVIANGPHPVLFQRRLYTDAAQRAASQYIRQFRDPVSDALIRRYGFAALLLRAFGHTAITPDTPPQEAARTVLRAFGTPAERIDASALTEAETLLARWREPGAATAMLNWYRASAVDVPAPGAPLGFPEGWREPPFPRIAMPTLVLWGEDDLALPPANLDGLEDFATDLTVHRIPGCGHFAPWQAPGAVNAALAAFLRP